MAAAIRARARLPIMRWSGRAPASPAIEAGKGRQGQGAYHRTDTQSRAVAAVVGIDIGNNSFQVIGSRWEWGQLVGVEMGFATATWNAGRCRTWVTSDRFAMSGQCPLVPQSQPNRCIAASDV